MYKPIIKLLRNHGIESWVCGAAARDLYLGRTPTENSLSVKATLTQLREELQDKLLEINEYDTSVSIQFMNKIYILFPLKKIQLVNTYYNFMYVDSLEEDASTRDFTINSLYYDPLSDVWFDFNNGRKDADNKLIKFIGDPKQRIIESKIRMIRAVILASILGDGWSLETASQKAIQRYHLKAVPIHSKQINEELVKLLKTAEKPSKAFKLMRSTKLLNSLFPELKETINIEQSNKSLNLDLFSHIMLAVDSVSIDKPNAIVIRLAALLHDIGKPYTEVITETGIHFYNHENVGAFLSERILTRWGFNRTIIEKIVILVRNHLFNTYSIKAESSIKKIISKVGTENIHDLLDLRIADRSGTDKKISMQKIDLLRDKINVLLAKISPQDFKLQISDQTILSILKKYTDNLEALPEVKRYLENKVIFGRLLNKEPNLKKAINKVIQISCPLDKLHLFKTWANIQSGNAETFPDGKLICGIYCNFLCNQYNKNQ